MVYIYDSLAHLFSVFVLEGNSAGQQLEGQYPQTPKIHILAVFLPFENLGRGVV